jgi:TonB family protein
MKTLAVLATLLAATASLAADPPGGQPKMLAQIASVTITSPAPALSTYALHAGPVIRKPWYARLLADAQGKQLSKEAEPKGLPIQGTTEIQFEVAPNGTIGKIDVTSGSGLKSLDAAVVESLNGFVLPALPEGSNAGPQTLTGRFKVTKTSESGLVEYLELLKTKHIF